MDNPAPVSATNIPSVNPETTSQKPITATPRVSIDQLLLAGAHFGHLTQRWNPKMKRYIFMARNGIYLIDLQKTQAALETACKAIVQISANGEDILFVGTKKQAREIIEAEAKRCESPYISFRWLGGTLTNFATIRRSIRTLENLEKMASDGTYEKITKKEILQIEKSKAKLTQTLEGIRNMRRLPGAVFVVDAKHEEIAVLEARKLNIPVFAILDTNADPDLIDYPIPANDDAYKSIWLITHAIADAILEGKRKFSDTEEVEKEAVVERPKEGRRRSRRRRSRGGAERREQQEAQPNEDKSPVSEAGAQKEVSQSGEKPEPSQPKPEKKFQQKGKPNMGGDKKPREGQSPQHQREGGRKDFKPPRPHPEGENKPKDSQLNTSGKKDNRDNKKNKRFFKPKRENDKQNRNEQNKGDSKPRDNRDNRPKEHYDNRPNQKSEKRFQPQMKPKDDHNQNTNTKETKSE